MFQLSGVHCKLIPKPVTPNEPQSRVAKPKTLNPKQTLKPNHTALSPKQTLKPNHTALSPTPQINPQVEPQRPRGKEPSRRLEDAIPYQSE